MPLTRPIVYTPAFFQDASLGALVIQVNTYLSTTLTPGTYQIVNIIWGMDATIGTPYNVTILTVPNINAANNLNGNSLQVAFVSSIAGGVVTDIATMLNANYPDASIVFMDMLEDGMYNFIITYAVNPLRLPY